MAFISLTSSGFFCISLRVAVFYQLHDTGKWSQDKCEQPNSIISVDNHSECLRSDFKEMFVCIPHDFLPSEILAYYYNLYLIRNHVKTFAKRCQSKTDKNMTYKNPDSSFRSLTAAMKSESKKDRNLYLFQSNKYQIMITWLLCFPWEW